MNHPTGIRFHVQALLFLFAAAAIIVGIYFGRMANEAPDFSRPSLARKVLPIENQSQASLDPSPGAVSLAAGRVGPPLQANVHPEGPHATEGGPAEILESPKAPTGLSSQVSLRAQREAAVTTPKRIELRNYCVLTVSKLEFVNDMWKTQGRSPTEAEESQIFRTFDVTREDYLTYRSANLVEVQNYLDENPELLAQINSLSANIREIIQQKESP